MSSLAVIVIVATATTPRLGAQTPTPTLDSLSQRIDALNTQLTATKAKLDQLKATSNVNVANIELLQAQVAKLEASVANLSLLSLAGRPCESNFPQLGTLMINLRLGSPLAMLCQPGTGRYIDGGLAVTDLLTGLMWEKKVAGRNCLHCADDVFTWNGAAFWLDQLNGRIVDSPLTENGAFLGYTDWRLPTVKELMAIQTSEHPAGIDPVFGPTAEWYWSASRSRFTPLAQWIFNFRVDMHANAPTAYEEGVRAVRRAF